MSSLYSIQNHTKESFTKKTLEIFQYQAIHNPVYCEYLNRISCEISTVNSIEKIPFLPISFFKTHTIITENQKPQQTFFSSGTTGLERSKHFVADSLLYKESYTKGFEFFFGSIKNYTILALLPSYLEQENSSLVYMVSDLIKQSQKNESSFYLDDYELVTQKIKELDAKGEKTLLIGVTYALLDLIEHQNFKLKNIIIMETGGMKGRRKELVKSELHDILKSGFGVSEIYSEYGMTELLSQAYSLGNQLFQTPPWMKILIREIEDPFNILSSGKSGGINIIDLANVNSCSFIATQDLGKLYADGSFEVLGRYDHSDIRGCNLML